MYPMPIFVELRLSGCFSDMYCIIYVVNANHLRLKSLNRFTHASDNLHMAFLRLLYWFDCDVELMKLN